MENYTKEIKQIINNYALPSTLRHLGNGKTEISEGFIRDTDGKFEKIAKAIDNFYREKFKQWQKKQ